nr:zinc ribbon domain-containing protein [Desulfobacterales bacterium]
MPIFEFRCLECGNIFEKLLTSSNEKAEMECPECRSTTFERVISRTNYVMGSGPGGKKPTLTSRSCSPGSSCMTLDIPGPTR